MQAVLPVSPEEAVVPADQDRKPLKPVAAGLEIHDRKPELPVGAAHIALTARAHRRIFDAEKDAAINPSAGMSAETMRVPLK